MSNERLRKAMANAHVSVEDVAEAAEVNPKTVHLRSAVECGFWDTSGLKMQVR